MTSRRYALNAFVVSLYPLPEEDADPPVDDAIEDELEPRIVVHRRAADEPRAERAVVSFLDDREVADEIARVVGAVGHHDRDDVALEEIEAGAHGEPEAGWVVRAGGSGHAGSRRVRARTTSAVASVLASSMTSDLVVDAASLERRGDATDVVSMEPASSCAGMTIDTPSPLFVPITHRHLHTKTQYIHNIKRDPPTIYSTPPPPYTSPSTFSPHPHQTHSPRIFVPAPAIS